MERVTEPVEYIKIPQVANDLAVWAWLIKMRDSFTCQTCGVVGTSRSLQAHHLNSEGALLLIENGITLCSHCHTAFHYGKLNRTILGNSGARRKISCTCKECGYTWQYNGKTTQLCPNCQSINWR